MRSVFDARAPRGLVEELSAAPFVGQGLARTIVANVVLPAIHARLSLDRSGDSRRVVDAFRKMPAPPPDAVTRGVLRSLYGLSLSGAPSNAAQHSGLHALARSASWPGQSNTA